MPQKLRKRKSVFRKEGRAIRPGTAPGTLTIDPNAPKPVIDIFAYKPDRDSSDFEEKTIENISELKQIITKWPLVWVNITGLGDLDVFYELESLFDIHRLALEDVLNVNQRPKAESFEKNLFITTRLFNNESGLQSEQISMFLGTRFVLTFQEMAGDCFSGVRDRLRKGKGRIRSSGPDYLCYALLDSIVDHNFPILELYGDTLEALEEEVLDKPRKAGIQKIYSIKRDLIALRRGVWPMREMISSLLREDSPFFQQETKTYLRDCYDHAIGVIDLVENYREITSGLVELYLSSVSNRMNEVMKVLTLIATIFLPLSFITGLYGMNFNSEISSWNMPELQWRFGYLIVLGVMFAISATMLVYFYTKGWIGRGR